MSFVYIFGGEGKSRGKNIGSLVIVETVGFFERKVSKLAQGLLRA